MRSARWRLHYLFGPTQPTFAGRLQQNAVHLNLLAKECAAADDTHEMSEGDIGYLKGVYHMKDDGTLATQQNEIAYQVKQTLLRAVVQPPGAASPSLLAGDCVDATSEGALLANGALLAIEMVSPSARRFFRPTSKVVSQFWPPPLQVPQGL